MKLNSADRIVIFIDGANLYSTAKWLNFDIDYKLLLSWAQKRGRLIRAYYYTTILEQEDYSPVRPLVDWLDYNGYTMVTKPVKEYTDKEGRRKFKGSMDVEITVDALTLADRMDHAILFTGDGNFRRLVEALQQRGVKVTVVSSVKTSPPMIADDLRRQADHFMDLDDLFEEIGRDYEGDEDDDEEEEAAAAAPLAK